MMLFDIVHFSLSFSLVSLLRRAINAKRDEKWKKPTNQSIGSYNLKTLDNIKHVFQKTHVAQALELLLGWTHIALGYSKK